MTDGSCSIEDCIKPANSRGMCTMHYARWRKAGGTGRKCTIDGCDRAHFGRGWCEFHYDRWRAYGDPLVTSVIVGDDETRFWSYVDKTSSPGGCWLWVGTITHENYGVFQVGGRQWKAHRWSYAHTAHELTDEDTIDHLCHTHHPDCHEAKSCPHRRCVNPHHLEAVSAEENISRGVVRRLPKTHCPAGHPYDEANTYEFGGSRRCRACHRLTEARRRATRKAA